MIEVISVIDNEARRVRRPKKGIVQPVPLVRRISKPYELQPPHQNNPTRFPLKKAA